MKVAAADAHLVLCSLSVIFKQKASESSYEKYSVKRGSAQDFPERSSSSVSVESPGHDLCGRVFAGSVNMILDWISWRNLCTESPRRPYKLCLQNL